MKKYTQILLMAIIFLTPLFLVTSGMRIALTPLFVNYEYKLPNFPPDNFGFTNEERLHWANLSIKYIRGRIPDDEFAALQFPDGSPLFNKREIDHMIDVRNLTVIMLMVWFTLTIFLIFIILVSWKNKWLRALLGALRNGAIWTIALILIILLFAAINFNKLFTLFHQIFFQGDSWLFYLSDTLIRLFPIKFWQDLFIFIGGFSIISSLLLIAADKYLGKKIEAQK